MPRKTPYELLAHLTPTLAKIADPDEVSLEALVDFYSDMEEALLDVVDQASLKVEFQE